jgi:hypothetical protein
MLFICICAKCDAVVEARLEDLSRVELDFREQVIRFICPECKKQNEMSLLTSNKLRDRALPGTRVARG